MHLIDMSAATTELVWGHGLLETTIGEHKVRYPLVATPVMIEYEPDKSLISVSPAGPSRLQTDALSGTDERYLGQLLALAGPAGTLETGSVERPGPPGVLRARAGPAGPRPAGDRPGRRTDHPDRTSSTPG